jgi:hypothetical protein
MRTLIKTCDLLAQIKELEHRVEQLEKRVEQHSVAIKVLWEVIDKIPPKYYKLQDNDLNENNA